MLAPIETWLIPSLVSCDLCLVSCDPFPGWYDLSYPHTHTHTHNKSAGARPHSPSERRRGQPIRDSK